MLTLLASAALVGCASRTPAPERPLADGSVNIPPGHFLEAFDAAREVLRDYRFDLDRIDARAGVISTTPKPTVGLASPWDAEQQSLRQEWEDLTNQQRRVVRVVFEPASAAVARDRAPVPQVAPGPPPQDLRDTTEPVTVRFEAVVERIHRPHWRVQTESIRNSTFATEPALRQRGMQPSYAVARDRDRAFEAALAEALRKRLGLPKT